MNRGDLYRVENPSARDPRRHRFFVIVSRPALITSRFASVICAPIYSAHHGLASQVLVGIGEGLPHDSSIHCDELVSLPKSVLTHYTGTLSPDRIDQLNQALKIALDIPD
jgi:mRNA interferase MazF